MPQKIKINWLWFFVSLLVYPVTDLLAALILSILPHTNYIFIPTIGIFSGAFLVVLSNKKSSLWDATLGIILYSFLASFLIELKFSGLILLLSLLSGFLGAWLGEYIKSGKKENNNQQNPKIEPKYRAIFSGGDGLSIENAVIINSFKGQSGISAEFLYAKMKYGAPDIDWKLEKQSLLRYGDKPYDVFDVTLNNGTKEKIYFDISNFFGKY